MIPHDKKTFVAVSAIWFERFLECSRTYGTEEFTDSVWRFYHSLLNLGEDKLAIKNIVNDYLRDDWRPRLDSKIDDSLKEEHINVNDKPIVNLFSKLCEKELIVELFEFIIQVIQDSGVGWPTKEEMQQFTITQD